jgi:hypothetical protein
LLGCIGTRFFRPVRPDDGGDSPVLPPETPPPPRWLGPKAHGLTPSARGLTVQARALTPSADVLGVQARMLLATSAKPGFKWQQRSVTAVVSGLFTSRRRSPNAATAVLPRSRNNNICRGSENEAGPGLAVSINRTSGPNFWFPGPFLNTKNCVRNTKNWVLNTKNCVRSIKNWVLNTKNCVRSIKNWVLNTKNCVRSIKNLVLNTKNCVRSIKNLVLNTKNCVRSIKNLVLNTKNCVRSIKNWVLNTKNCVRSILETPFSLVFMGFSIRCCGFAPKSEKCLKKVTIPLKPA